MVAGGSRVLVIGAFEYAYRTNRLVAKLTGAPSDSVAVRPVCDNWGKKKEFRLVELAWLWEDLEPAGYPLPDIVKARFDKLGQDAHAQALHLNYPDDAREAIWEVSDARKSGNAAKANPEWVVSRSDAMTYARRIDERPPFLFPMERV